MNKEEHEAYHAGRELYAKMKLLRIMHDKIMTHTKRISELHKESIKLFENHFKIKGDK